MENFNSNQTSQNRLKLSVGEIVIVEEKDWTIADITENNIVLYRERVDGSSCTLEITADELTDLLVR